MLIFLDTEFTDLHRSARLISIGLVAEDGERAFYAELTDTYRPELSNEFVKASVLPLLQGGDVRMSMTELTPRLAAWLASFNSPVQLATDSLAYDWPWIQQLFKKPGTWPPNLDGKPFILQFDADPGEKFNDALERAFAGGLRRHHALDDAKANRLGWLGVALSVR